MWIGDKAEKVPKATGGKRTATNKTRLWIPARLYASDMSYFCYNTTYHVTSVMIFEDRFARCVIIFHDATVRCAAESQLRILLRVCGCDQNHKQTFKITGSI